MKPVQLAHLPWSLRLLRRLALPRKLGLLEKLFGKSLGRLGTQWVECCNGVIWKLDLSDVCHRWLIYGLYEGGDGIRFAQKCLQKGGVYIDSGANIGQWLLYIAPMGGVRSLAIEPVSSQRQWLQECLAWQDGWQVTIDARGLAEQRQEVEIQCDAARSTLALDWFAEKDLPRESIQVAPLAEVLTEHGIEQVTFWKLDVEGAELGALLGAKSLLAKQQIETIYLECHPSNYAAIGDLFEANGYALYQLNGKRLIPFTNKQINKTEELVAKPLP